MSLIQYSTPNITKSNRQEKEISYIIPSDAHISETPIKITMPCLIENPF